jgi:CRP-like cAMP-binding protein
MTDARAWLAGRHPASLRRAMCRARGRWRARGERAGAPGALCLASPLPRTSLHVPPRRVFPPRPFCSAAPAQTTNVAFYAIFKFSLVVISVPHWVGCVWWILGERSSQSTPFAIPSWTAQYSLASGVADRFEPTKMSAVERYLVSQYMSWSGVTSTGYGSITLVTQPEIWFGCLIILVQIVFYAFVLGTLFHYLVRTDENTVKFKEIIKAVEEYGVKRHLPPTVARKMHAHFEFQHRKHASSTEVVFQQLPLSLRLRVASAQYKRVVEVTWIFGRCNSQFLDQLVMVLRERYVMPLEMLFDRGDGSRELLWCVSGTLHVRKGEQHIATVRSDLGSSPIVGEIAFILGIVQPYTVSATDASEVTLLVLSVTDFDETITSYPEQVRRVRAARSLTWHTRSSRARERGASGAWRVRAQSVPSRVRALAH